MTGSANQFAGTSASMPDVAVLGSVTIGDGGQPRVDLQLSNLPPRIAARFLDIVKGRA